jgi:hypothetical protein
MKRQTYRDGGDIHVGDRVFYHGQPGVIAFIADHNEYSLECPKEEWPGFKTGFMIVFSNGARLHLDSPDEHFARTKQESMG